MGVRVFICADDTPDALPRPISTLLMVQPLSSVDRSPPPGVWRPHGAGVAISRPPPTGVSFNPDTLSVDAVGTDPTVDVAAVVANLKPVALPGFDEVGVLVTVDLAQNNITNLQVIRMRRHNGA